MIRIAGVSINQKKQVRFGLTAIKGIGKNSVKEMLDKLKIAYNTTLEDLSEKEMKSIRTYIEDELVTEEDIVNNRRSNIKRLLEIKCWRGDRHRKHLPVRGQRTKTNSRTCRGNKRATAGSGRTAVTKT